MNKIFAIPSKGKTEKSLLDLRFGKCEYVAVYQVPSGKFSIFKNPFKDSENSGIRLVELLKEKGVSTIITGEVGPNVSELLKEEKIQLVLLNKEKVRIDEIFDRLKQSYS